jgi:Flp pilus assembly protein TadD
VALSSLADAAAREPANPRYAYVHAVALQSAGRLDEALRVLAQATERHPGDAEILVALVTFNRDAGRRGPALDHARKLQALLPGSPEVARLLREPGP